MSTGVCSIVEGGQGDYCTTEAMDSTKIKSEARHSYER